MRNFLIGFGLGVAGAILFAPKSGRDTRGYLGSAASGSADYVKRQTSELRESAMDMVERGKGVVNRQMERLSPATPNATTEMYQR
jgi:gas vesicle protein